MRKLQPRHRHEARSASVLFRARRQGLVVLELILFLPVLFLLLCAVVEFGLIQANLVHLASASRAGAKLAAESVGIEGSTPKDLVLKIQASLDRHFQSAGLGSEAVYGVTVRHNVEGGGVASRGMCGDPLLPSLPNLGRGAVRVTVCVKLNRLAPDLLGSFGFSIAERVAESTTTLAYET